MKLFYVLGILLLITSAVVFIFLNQNSVNELIESNDTDQVVIGFLMASNSSSIERWIKDRDLFVKRAEELNAKVVVLDAGIDAVLQQQQAENLILQGVDVLVIVAQDAYGAATIVDMAHEAGIKVVAYDRLIKNPTLDYYVSFDNVKVGEAQAQGVLDVKNKGKFAYIGGSETDTNAFLVKEGAFYILQPLIDSGDIEIVHDVFTPDWKQELAYTDMKRFLASGGVVDAVVAANDSTAAGVILALEEFGLAGLVPVSGQDASLSAVRAILKGDQTVTVYKPIKNLAYKSAEIAVSVAKGEEVEINSSINNDTVLTPAYLLDVTPVTKANVDETVIADGFLNKKEVYGE